MSTRCSELFELRSYLAKPGRRDELIGMFESIFLDAYQAGGARIVGTFRSLDEPDRWVWMRAFADAASRGPALENFYSGDVWRRHAEACDAMIAEISEAMLLREVHPGSVDALCGAQGRSLYELTVYPTASCLCESPARLPTAALVTDHSENSYPRQPVRLEPVCVTLTRLISPVPSEGILLVPSARSALR